MPKCCKYVWPNGQCTTCGRQTRRGLVKPRVKFCWLCGNKLWGNVHVEKEVDGHVRVLHKTCAKRYEEGRETDASQRPFGSN